MKNIFKPIHNTQVVCIGFVLIVEKELSIKAERLKGKDDI
jgi:hypothetical protein